MFSSKPSVSFTCFSELPPEIRLMVWELASLHPRIVHLSKKRLGVDGDPGWWRRVRSDKSIDGPIDGPGDDDSDYGSFDEDGIDCNTLNLDVAKKRLLTPDATYGGNLSRAEAKAILLRRPHRPGYTPVAGWDYPQILYGLKSESPVPGTLLACRESFKVASRIYCRAFGSLGAFPETWFNFSQDTLYLDGLTAGVSYSIPGHWYPDRVVRQLFAADELIRIRKLAVLRPQFGSLYWADLEEDGEQFALHDFIQRWLDLTPSVDQLTIVDKHYAHQERTMSTNKSNKEVSREQYEDLRFMKSTFDNSEFCWRINGFRIDAALLQRGIHVDKDSTNVYLERIQRDWESRASGACWQLPKINVEVIASTLDEERLLHDAYMFEKKHNKGCWYINPRDPSDCDYFAEADIDNRNEHLL